MKYIIIPNEMLRRAFITIQKREREREREREKERLNREWEQ